MPIFEYQCNQCEHEFETLILGSQTAECPSCGTDKLTKLFSVPAAPVMKGGSLPMSSCPPADAPPCSPSCCRLP
jgi:putative FmdB family regulatory protein